MSPQASRSVLAVYGFAKGVGYVLFESPLSIIDWGVRVVSGSRKNLESSKAVSSLIETYVPDVLVLDDTTATNANRTKRIRSLYRLIEGVAHSHGLTIERFRKDSMISAFDKLGCKTKQERASLMASLLPGLFHKLPKPRRAWDAADPNMAMFEAACLGYAYYGKDE